MWYNKIQVFGLPRSGTNWIEWILKNNFVNLKYNMMHEVINDVEGSFPYWTEYKHNYPNLDYCSNAIVIWKPYEEWLESIKRQGWVFQVTKETHQKYIDRGFELGDKGLVIEHGWAMNNYDELLNTISSKFDVKLIDNPIQPTKRIDMAGFISDEDYIKN